MAQIPLASVDRVDVLSLMDNSVDVLMAGTAVSKRVQREKSLFERLRAPSPAVGLSNGGARW